MDDKTPKYSTVIDFLFPFDMSYFFTSKKMETSIKVIILGLIVCSKANFPILDLKKGPPKQAKRRYITRLTFPIFEHVLCFSDAIQITGSYFLNLYR